MEKSTETNRFALDRNLKQSPKSFTLKAEKKGSFLNKIMSTRNAIAGIFIIQVLTLILLIVIINPSLVFEQLDAVRVINKVSSLTSVPPSEVPVIARVGDKKLLPDIEELKKANEVNAQVYKDAKNGDYVLGFTSKLIIYRMEENKVIYEGNTPQKILTDTQQAIINNVVAKAKGDALISTESTEVPQVAVVTDPTALKATNSIFYANAQLNDIVATFSQSSVVILYRPSTDEIVNSGNFTTTIN